MVDSMSGDHVCPWWMAYTFDNPLRRLIHNPEKILGDYVTEGMTVLDVGCGMGYFSLGLARIVGNTGKVISVDLQQKMLDILQKRASKAGLLHRIEPHICDADNLNVNTPVDFALAFWMVHEMPDPENFFGQVSSVLKPAGKLLYAEPSFHVPEKQFNEIRAAARKTGLQQINDLKIAFSRATLFTL
jgi:ubiquinone/menaquinone biosynthesis C-methylase UbiE